MPMKISQTAQKILSPEPEKGPTRDAEIRELKEACREFEAIFLRELLKNMRSTVPGKRSRDEEMYNSLFDGQVSRCLAKRGIGLGELLADSLVGEAGLDTSQDSPKVSGEAADNESREVRQQR